MLSARFLWIDAFVNLAVAIVPVSTENEEIASDHDIIRTFMGCVSGKLRESHDLATIPVLVTIDILSPTITAWCGDILIFGIFTVLALAHDKTMFQE